MANLKNDPLYDPFPLTGYVRQFKNAILKELSEFLRKYPKVDKQDALFKLVELAVEAEKRFKPELGHSFWTYCQYVIRAATRDLVVKEQKHQSILVHRSPVPREQSDAERAAEDKGDAEFKTRDTCADDASKEAKKIIERGNLFAELDRRFAEEFRPTGPLVYGTGGNAATVALDLNANISGWVTVGVRLYDKAQPHVGGVMDRLSTDLRALLGFEPLSKEPRLLGRMRAVIAHGERQQREADQEAENQKNGNYDPVFLDVHDGLRPGINIREPNKPKLYSPPPRISEAPDLKRLDPVLRQYSHPERLALLMGAAETLSLDDRERAVLDWLLDPRDRTLTALATEIDITKGYASKLRGRVLNLLGKQMTGDPERCTQLIERGCEILTDRDLFSSK